MNVQYSQISCGIRELSGVGNDPKQTDLEALAEQLRPYLRNEYGNITRNGGAHSCALLVASLNDKQKKAAEFLENNGFIRVGPWVKNPNSGNKIALWIASINEDGRPVPYSLEIPTGYIKAELPAPVEVKPYVKFRAEKHTIRRDHRGRFVKGVQIQATT